MTTIPAYTTRRGWQATATWPGGTRIIARGSHLRCVFAALWHRLRHPTHRTRVEPIP